MIKLERPGVGDPMRHSGGLEAMCNGVNLFWMQESRNKKSISCDLHKPRGQQLIKELVKQKDIFEDAHYWERETLVRMTDPVVGEVAMPGPIPHLSRTPGRIEWLGPARIGEHNQEVYGGMLGLPAAEIAQLQADGVI